MNGRDVLRKGQFMRHRAGIWRVWLLKDAIIHLINVDTNETDKISLRTWQAGCFDGTIEMVVDPNADVEESTRQLLGVSLRDLPPSMQAAANRAYFYVSAFMDPAGFYERYLPAVPAAERRIPTSKSKKQVKPFLLDVATARQRELAREGAALNEEPPGFSTLCGWLTKVERHGSCDARILAPRHDKRGPQKRFMSPRVEGWLSEIADRVWLNPDKNKRRKVFEALREEVDAWNANHPERPERMISERQVYRYLSEEIDQGTEIARRKGKEHADRIFKPVGLGPEPSDILEVVEVDHTRADVDVCDDRTGRKLGRPWITTALDRYSRMPVGVSVHFDGPSIGAVMQCLRNAMMPKGFLREFCPGIDYDYPCGGVPVAFFFDRGTDFDNDHLREVALTFDIRLDYEPVGCPQYKAKLERWHRTMAEEVAHPLPGATPPADGDGIRRDPSGNAYISFSAFVRRLWLWIAMVYAREPHRGIRDIPLRRWQEAESRRLPRPVRKRDDLNILLNRVEYLVPTNKGLTWKETLRWNGDVIKSIRTHPGFDRRRRPKDDRITTNEQWLKDTMGGRLKVRIDETDLGVVWVTDPVTRAQVAVEAVDKEYQSGLSLYQHRMCLLWLDEKLDGARDSEALRVAKAALMAEEDDLRQVRRGKLKGIASVARHAGIGRRAPAGADTGSLADAGVEGRVDTSTQPTIRPDRQESADQPRARKFPTKTLRRQN